MIHQIVLSVLAIVAPVSTASAAPVFSKKACAEYPANQVKSAYKKFLRWYDKQAALHYSFTSKSVRILRHQKDDLKALLAGEGEGSTQYNIESMLRPVIKSLGYPTDKVDWTVAVSNHTFLIRFAGIEPPAVVNSPYLKANNVSKFLDFFILISRDNGNENDCLEISSINSGGLVCTGFQSKVRRTLSEDSYREIADDLFDHEAFLTDHPECAAQVVEKTDNSAGTDEASQIEGARPKEVLSLEEVEGGQGQDVNPWPRSIKAQ